MDELVVFSFLSCFVSITVPKKGQQPQGSDRPTKSSSQARSQETELPCLWLQINCNMSMGHVRGLIGRVCHCGGPASVRHCMKRLWDQGVAVLPITLALVFVISVIFDTRVDDMGRIAAGIAAAIAGLALFLHGLRVAFMPLADHLGHGLPLRFPFYVVLVVMLLLGVLVTYAEPAIASLRPLGEAVDPRAARYLFYVFNAHEELLILAIGVGVGAAAVLGTVRLLFELSLKPLILMAFVPVAALTLYMQWGDARLRRLIPLAWDTGAVTTGPVTVPVILALGLGTSRMVKSRRQTAVSADEAHRFSGVDQPSSLETTDQQTSVSSDAGRADESDDTDTTDSFGVVTLASLLPILVVQLLSIGIVSTTSETRIEEFIDEFLNGRGLQDNGTRTVQRPSLSDDAMVAMRAVLPLAATLVLMELLLLRQGLPALSFSDAKPRHHTRPSELRQERFLDTAAGHSAGQGQLGLEDEGVPPQGQISSQQYRWFVLIVAVIETLVS